MKLVHIEWSDAHHIGAGEWVDPDELRPGVAIITVGFLLTDKHKHYTVAASIDEAGHATGVFAVPKSAVKRYTILMEGT